MINKRTLIKKMKQKNIQALDLIMMKLMKPDTSMLFLKSITLKDLKKWSEQTEIKAFLAATETASLNSLKSVHLYVFSYSLYELML